ncbi:DUF1194 domain-containing protein [Ferrovibrio xuzhouensis]|uniref:DUF1194 domain-containing protein n=1 Tax=Ferrovibrio xuzhouensis TaxID=1576914 RepID=A0ABV7VCH4_9PROT
MLLRPVVASVLALVAAAGFLLPRMATAGEKPAVDLALMLAVDISGSIDLDEARLQREGYAQAISDPAVIKAITSGINGRIAVAYFEWSDSYTQNALLDWTVISDRASAEAVARKLTAEPITTARRTSISGAIQFALPRFAGLPYTALRRVLDISGDGPNNDGGPVDLARDAALAAGIAINGLPIMNGRQNSWGFPTLPDLDKYYEGCVIGGPGAFVVVAEDFASFDVAVRRKLILEIAAAPVPTPATRPRVIRAQTAGGYGQNGYDRGCDIGEKQSREFWRRRFDQ